MNFVLLEQLFITNWTTCSLFLFVVFFFFYFPFPDERDVCITLNQVLLFFALWRCLLGKSDCYVFCLSFFFSLLSLSRVESRELFRKKLPGGMPYINVAAALQICALLSALPAQYFISQWYGTDSAQRIQVTERLEVFISLLFVRIVLFLIPNDTLSWKVGVWVRYIGHSYTKTVFKSHLRHFCGLMSLFICLKMSFKIWIITIVFFTSKSVYNLCEYTTVPQSHSAFGHSKICYYGLCPFKKGEMTCLISKTVTFHYLLTLTVKIDFLA